MNRRKFFRTSSFAGLSLTSLPFLQSCGNSNSNQKKEEIPDFNFELDELSIDELQKLMAEGKHTCRSITELYLNRIQKLDKNGPALNSVIELNPDALVIADTLDKERKDGKIRGPMHGIPLLIKDNIDTADKMETTAGALALSGHIAAKDAFLVQKLRDAGALILGKTNLSEWANFRSTQSSSGWSSRGGQTRNPYLTDRSPCGSSSGTGAAVAANLCAVGIGTETDGSITCPSSVNALVGLKPTVGLVSRSGIIPISHTQDTAGPMTRTVRDCAILLAAIAGKDNEDKATAGIEDKILSDYTQFLKTDALKGKRIGIEKKPQSSNPYLNKLFSIALESLKKSGADIIEISYLDYFNKLGEAEYEILKYEFKYGVNKYLSQANAQVKTLKEVIEFNLKNEEKAMPFFRQEILEMCEAKGGLEEKAYLDALEKCHKGSQKFLSELISANKLDAICGLTGGPACSIDVVYGDKWGDVSLTMPAAISGYPHITVPCGFVYELPVGLSFFSTAYTEPQLLAIAYAYEQATKNRLKPEFREKFKV
ncbi:MAG: amidase [Bacteroidales bacterium]